MKSKATLEEQNYILKDILKGNYKVKKQNLPALVRHFYMLNLFNIPEMQLKQYPDI